MSVCRAFLYFVCVVSIFREFLYLVVLLVFAGSLCIWLCCVYLQGVSVFGCVVSMCMAFLYFIVLISKLVTSKSKVAAR